MKKNKTRQRMLARAQKLHAKKVADARADALWHKALRMARTMRKVKRTGGNYKRCVFVTDAMLPLFRKATLRI